MDDEILMSRRRVTRRRALAIGGAVSLSGLLAACRSDDGASSAGTGTGPAPTPAGATDLTRLLDEAPRCLMTRESAQGPYWFDVDSIRGDIREGRPGARLDLALRVQDLSACGRGGEATPVSNAVVEIWHCDAGGVYSGFESASAGGPPGGGGQGSQGGRSDGSYSAGEREAFTGDDGTYLRGAQPSGRDGIARFTTIYPGWYGGRTVHIHLKVHVDKRTVLTSQLYFEERVTDEVFKGSPYDRRGGRDVGNEDDPIYDRTGMLSVTRTDHGRLGVINLGIEA